MHTAHAARARSEPERCGRAIWAGNMGQPAWNAVPTLGRCGRSPEASAVVASRRSIQGWAAAQAGTTHWLAGPFASAQASMWLQKQEAAAASKIFLVPRDDEVWSGRGRGWPRRPRRRPEPKRRRRPRWRAVPDWGRRPWRRTKAWRHCISRWWSDAGWWTPPWRGPKAGRHPVFRRRSDPGGWAQTRRGAEAGRRRICRWRSEHGGRTRPRRRAKAGQRRRPGGWRRRFACCQGCLGWRPRRLGWRRPGRRRRRLAC